MSKCQKSPIIRAKETYSEATETYYFDIPEQGGSSIKRVLLWRQKRPIVKAKETARYQKRPTSTPEQVEATLCHKTPNIGEKETC
jgi:hypothetical protein